MTDYSLTKARVVQWLSIIAMIGLFAGAYWYFGVRAGIKTNTAGTQPQGAGDLSAGLAGYWKLDDGSGTNATDSSTNGNTGTLTNGPTWTTGQVGSAVDFDGTDDYVTAADAGTLDVVDSTNFTLSGWFNRDTFAADHTIIAKSNGQTAADTGYNVYIDDTTDKVTFVANDGTDQYKLESTSTFVATGWNHFALVWTEGSTTATQLFINGLPQAATATGTMANVNSLANAVAFRVGAESDAGSPFDGKIDEVRLYNRALSVDEVSQLYRVTSPTGVDTSLKGYWSFNGQDMNGTTAYDRSGAGNNGTLTSGPTSVRGQVGQALNFDGTNDYVDAGSAAILDDLTQKTICAWAYPETIPASYGQVVSKRDSSGWTFEINNDAGNNRLSYFNMFSGTSGHWASPVDSVPFNVWSHVCVTYDNSSVSNDAVLYVNGLSVPVTERETPVGTRVSDATSSLRIGAVNGSSELFDGKIDEARIFNRILSASEIKALYDLGQSDKTNTSVSQPQGTGRLDSGLAGYWALDNGSGTSATDSSTNGNTGTLTNGPIWGTGQIGSMVDFDGTDDYITVADPASGVLDVLDSTNFTLSGWFNRGTFTTDDTIIAKSNGQTAADTGYNVYIDDTTDKVTFVANDGTDQYKLESISTFTATGWHHYTIVWNDSSATETKLYIDGVSEVATATGTFTSVNSLANAVAFRLGAESDAGSPFSGKLDEGRFYNRPLSADEVSQLYRLTSPTGVDTGLDGYWSFNGNDMSGTTVYDRSGVGKNGTLVNSPTITTGKFGQALYFNGTNQSVTVPAVATGTTFTITAWIRPNNLTGSWNNIFAQDDNSCFQVTSGRKLLFDNGGGWNTSLTAMPDKEWSFVGVVITAGSGVYYLNGNPDGATVTGVTSRNYVVIGNDGAAEAIEGHIDELRFYGRALSDAEMKALYSDGAGEKVNTSVSQPQGTGRLDSGLAGYWKLDENTGTSATDSSTNGNTGTLTNGPTWTTGQIGSAVDFDGTDDYVTAADANTLDVVDSTNFTLSGWFNRDTFVADHTIIAKSNGQTAADTGYNVFIDDTTDKVTFVANDGTDQYKLESVSTFVATGWNHFAIVWTEGSTTATQLYINGFPQAATATGTMANVNSLANAVAFRVGAESDAGSPFDGKLDEIRLYNRALSGSEVLDMYKTTAPVGADTSLKGYWSFNGQDMNGTTAFDRSGVGNNGTLTNGPTRAIGKLGQGLSFDGTNDEMIFPAITTGTTFSLSFWIKPMTQVSTYGALFVAASSGSPGLSYRGSAAGASAGKVNYYFGGTGHQNNTPLADGVWSHVVFSVNAGNGQYYVNGVPDGTVSSVPSLALANMGYDVDSEPFKGSLDEARIYNRALSDTEVTALYNSSR